MTINKQRNYKFIFKMTQTNQIIDEQQTFNWYYRSDKDPMTLKEDAEWTGYTQTEEIEIFYQDYLTDKSKDYSTYKLEDEYIIDFENNVQRTNDNSRQRLIGRFDGDPSNSKNYLTFDKFRWYFRAEEHPSQETTSPLWAPYRIDDNEQIELAFYNYTLSKGGSTLKKQFFTIDFSKYVEVTDGKEKQIGRFKVCPTNITRVEKYHSEIKPQQSDITTLTESSIKQIKKDYFLKFKNIFPSKFHAKNSKVTYFYNSTEDIVVIHFSQDFTCIKVLNKLEEKAKFNSESNDSMLLGKGYKKLCEIEMKGKGKTLLDIKIVDLPPQKLGNIFKYNWYHKYDEQYEHLWQQYNNLDNSTIRHAYKHKYFVSEKEEIDINENIKINFKNNKEVNLNDGSQREIIRFYPKNAFPDQVEHINIPEEVFQKMNDHSDSKRMQHQVIHYANKFGPQNFNELIVEITRELKEVANLLNHDEMFESYNLKHLTQMNYTNFYHLIIMIYTEEGFVYRTINKILRDKQYDEFWKMKYYYFSLLYSLEKAYEEDKSITFESLYRGMKLKEEQIKFYKALKEGQMIMFNEFLSTTYNKDIALKYAKNLDEYVPGSCLFEIKIPENENLRIALIEDHSQFKHENEVLLSSGSILKFDSFNNADNELASLKFTLISSNLKAFSDYIEKYSLPEINLKEINLDLKGIKSLFESLNNNNNIKKISLLVEDISTDTMIKAIKQQHNLTYIELFRKAEFQ